MKKKISTTDVAAPESSGGARRRTIWQTVTNYHCSIVGICLRRRDMRALARRKLFSGCRDGYSDYRMHSYLVTTMATRSEQSRALAKMLDAKYRLAVKRYAEATDETEIEVLWREDLAAGRIAGAYWAIMTHPAAGAKFLSTIYGHCHLLGYDLFGQYRRDLQEVERLREQVSALEEVVAAERLEHLEEREHLLQEGAALRERIHLQQSAQPVSRETISEEPTAGADRQDELSERLTRLHRRERELVAENLRLAAACEQMEGELARARDNLQAQEKQLSRACREIEELRDELKAVELALLAGTPEESCTECSEAHTGQCPGKNLCGKTILYVGGQHKMVPRYREMVEKFGAQFIHHDGGRESSRRLLPQLLGGADLVFCPVDCVSHDACYCVKNMCKRYRKPFVMMRSSGLSSLAKELSRAVQ
jgi:hypothetical protein